MKFEQNLRSKLHGILSFLTENYGSPTRVTGLKSSTKRGRPDKYLDSHLNSKILNQNQVKDAITGVYRIVITLIGSLYRE